ncbi:hypothetical protein C8Q73DRAFT_503816 [Cubamyces lactineus]|nr:hypothetical protein C8Q73DRAFT_503816 [Cubamyces lactineus]
MESQNSRMAKGTRRSLSSTPIIFLPITADFDHRNLQDWASLSKRIGDWLLRVVAERRSIIWRWGREAFWITFVAAYPSFPRGDWPRWPCEIALDGPFICHWVERQQTSAHVEDGGEDVADAMHDSPAVDTNIPLLRDVHAELWARLQNHLSVLRDV